MPEFHTKSPAETRAIAETFASSLRGGEVIALQGDIGVGKTVFTKGLAAGLGITSNVTSPTFNIVRQYNGRLPLYHFDVYRITDPDEMLEIGFEEYLYSGAVVVIEWPELISDLIPQDAITITIEREEEDIYRQKNMIILAIDTTGKVCSTAVSKDGKLLSEEYRDVGLTHSASLMPMIETVLGSAGVDISDIDRIAVSNGPGSFTGVRIGVCAAKALAHARGIPICGISTLEAMSHNIAHFDGTVVPMIDARRGEVYAAAFRDGKRIMPDTAGPIEQILDKIEDKIICLGDGATALHDRIIKLRPDALFAPANLAFQRAGSSALLAEKTEPHTYCEIKPHYLRESGAERKKGKSTS